MRNKAFRILLIALLGLSASVWMGATGMAPAAPVANAAAVATAAPVAPAAPAAEAAEAAPQAATQVVMGEGSGMGSGMGYGFGEGSYLGIDSQDVTKERMADLKLKEERGVEVLMVDQDAPAGKAGLKEHDVILEFNGTKLESVEQLRRLIHEMPAGRTVTLGISRDGQPLTLTATLAERSKHYSFNMVNPKVKMPKVVIPKIDTQEFTFVLAGSSRSGLLVESLTPQLGEFFGAKNGEGVLVRSVERGSPAEAAGFKAGDIIVRVEKDKVADKGDWRSAMRTHRSGKVAIGIIRDRKEQTLSLDLPEVKEQGHVWHIEQPDMEDLDNDLDEMDIEINRLGPEMEHLKPEMERLKKDLSGQLSASLTQNRDELRKAVVVARDQQRGARAAQRARLDAQCALAQQRRELEKARVLMQQREMD